MAAKIRDIAKTRAQRIGEVFSLLHQKAGQANGELVAFGGNITVHSTNTQIAVSDTCAVIGQAIVDKAAQVAIAIPAGAATGAGQECQVLLELDATGTITATAGAVAATGLSTRPVENTARITLGVVKVTASFTPGTTPVTGGMITKEVYFT